MNNYDPWDYDKCKPVDPCKPPTQHDHKYCHETHDHEPHKHHPHPHHDHGHNCAPHREPCPPPVCGPTTIQAQYDEVFRRMHRMEHGYRDFQARGEALLQDVKSKAYDVGAYYGPKEVKVETGYSPGESSLYQLTRIKHKDCIGNHITMQLKLAADNTTNSRLVADIQESSEIEYADKMFSCQPTNHLFPDDGWMGMVSIDGALLPSDPSAYPELYTFGFDCHNKLKVYPNSNVSIDLLRQDRIRFSMGCIGVIVSDKQVANEDLYNKFPEYDIPLARVCIGQNYATRETMVLSCGDYDNPGMTLKAAAEILASRGCDLALALSTGSDAQAADKGGLMFVPRNDETPRQPKKTGQYAFLYISRRCQFRDQATFTIAGLIQRVNKLLWTGMLTQKQLDDFYAEYKEFLEEYYEWKALVEERLELIEERLDAHDEKLQEIDDRLAIIEARLDALEAVIGTWDDRISAIEKAILDLNENYIKLMELWSQILAQWEEMKVLFNDLQNLVHSWEQRIKDMEEIVNDLKEQWENFDTGQILIDIEIIRNEITNIWNEFGKVAYLDSKNTMDVDIEAFPLVVQGNNGNISLNLNIHDEHFYFTEDNVGTSMQNRTAYQFLSSRITTREERMAIRPATGEGLYPYTCVYDVDLDPDSVPDDNNVLAVACWWSLDPYSTINRKGNAYAVVTKDDIRNHPYDNNLLAYAVPNSFGNINEFWDTDYYLNTAILWHYERDPLHSWFMFHGNFKVATYLSPGINVPGTMLNGPYFSFKSLNDAYKRIFSLSAKVEDHELRIIDLEDKMNALEMLVDRHDDDLINIKSELNM